MSRQALADCIRDHSALLERSWLRIAACRFAISSAAEMPLPLMSPTTMFEMGFIFDDEIIVIAADHARRFASAKKGHAGRLRQLFGKERRLDLTRNFQLLLQALLLARPPPAGVIWIRSSD